MFNHYSTFALSDAKSIDAWRLAMAEVYYRLDIESHRSDRLNGEIIDRRFASIGISNFKADAQRVIRRKEAAKDDKSEDFVFLFPTRKSMRFEQRGRTGLVDPGHVFLLNSAENYVVDVPNGSENITIKIDRELLIKRVAGIDDLCAAMNIANLHMVPAVTTLAEQLAKLEPGDNAERVQQSVIDLICLMLELRDVLQEGTFTRQPLATSMFNRFTRYLRQNLHDHELTPGRAARDHKISVRYLHKIFQYHGASFGETLLELRLRRARQMITASSAERQANIGEIASECGFANQSYFSACYRKRFGLAPRNTKADAVPF